MKMQEESGLKTFVSGLEKQFDSRIISLIFFGSQRYKRSKIGSDYDLYFVLDSYDIGDINLIYLIIKNSDINIDLTIQYLDQMPINPNYFQDGSMGCFALDYLALGECLMGKNIFKKYSQNIDKNHHKSSILRKINEYAYRYRRELITLDLSEEYLLKFTKKYLSRLIIDIFLYWELYPLSKLRFMNPDEIFELSLKTVWFKKLEIDFTNKNNAAQETIKLRHDIFEKIYGTFISEIQNNFSKDRL